MDKAILQKNVPVHGNVTPHTARTHAIFLQGRRLRSHSGLLGALSFNPTEHFRTRLGCLSEIWITLLSKLIGYGRHCCKLGAQLPEKGWGPCTKHASTNEGRDGRQGRWHTISTGISKDPINFNIYKISIQFPLHFANLIRLFQKRPKVMIHQNQLFSICTGFVQFQLSSVHYIFSEATF